MWAKPTPTTGVITKITLMLVNVLMIVGNYLDEYGLDVGECGLEVLMIGGDWCVLAGHSPGDE